MAYTPADGGSSSGSGKMSYPTDRMNETAQKMITNANNSLEQHNAAWAQIQTFVQSFPGFMQAPVMAVLNPYEQRLRASYQWQIDCANALTNGSQQMQQADHAVARGFGRN